jgi:hypothetical protein
MKRLFKYFIVLIICLGIIYFKKPIATYLYTNFIFKKEILIPEVTSYRKEYNFAYIQNTENFYPKNKEEILNVIYTILNSGWTEFSFYCADGYDCNSDVNDIAADSSLLSNINNFVHPYNTYETISISINNFNKVTIKVTHQYSDEDILLIDKKVNEIYDEIITDDMSDYDKIKKVHDYIINNTVYDQKKERDEVTKAYKYKSNTALGPLLYGYALCGGYTDAMAIFLEKMNIKNYRISSENHIWNLVYINGEWKHLDLTWDDPITSTGENILTYKFFLINTTTLKNLDKEQHEYDETIYIETK